MLVVGQFSTGAQALGAQHRGIQTQSRSQLRPGGRGSQLPPAFSCPLLFCCFVSGVLYVEDTATS